MKRIPLLIFLLAGISLHAQIQGISIQIESNVSMIRSVRKQEKIPLFPTPRNSGYQFLSMNISIEESFEMKPGFQTNGTLDYRISPIFFISSRVGVQYLQFKRKISFKENSSTPRVEIPTRVGQPLFSYHMEGIWNDDMTKDIFIGPLYPGNTSLLTSQATLMAGTSFFKHRFSIRSGPSVNYLINAHYKKNVYTTQQTLIISKPGTSENWYTHQSNTGSIEEKTFNDTKGYSKFLMGFAVEASYNFLRAFSMDAGFQTSFTPIYEAYMRSAGKAKMKTVSLGVSYRFN